MSLLPFAMVDMTRCDEQCLTVVLKQVFAHQLRLYIHWASGLRESLELVVLMHEHAGVAIFSCSVGTTSLLGAQWERYYFL